MERKNQRKQDKLAAVDESVMLDPIQNSSFQTDPPSLQADELSSEIESDSKLQPDLR
jgi:hypothetical protein